jgi:hypothetical protein
MAVLIDYRESNGLHRYDMLCFEGISLMLKIFQGKAKSPNYRLVAPADGKLQTITVKEEVRQSWQDGGHGGMAD